MRKSMLHDQEEFRALHLAAEAQHLSGNGDIGRYLLLPGSDGRAELMSRRLQNLSVHTHDRRHNLYLGSLVLAHQSIDVGIISTGMGCPSIDIIATEVLKLGAKRLLRVGTAGSLQGQRIPVGSIVSSLAAVRDEGTSQHYLHPSIPVLASFRFQLAIQGLIKQDKWKDKLHLGITHTKDSLYAREFGEGPLRTENQNYMQHLKAAGVLASEMECAQLFTLAQLAASQAALQGKTGPKPEAAALLAIIGDDRPFAPEDAAKKATESMIELAFLAIAAWYEIDKMEFSLQPNPQDRRKSLA